MRGANGPSLCDHSFSQRSELFLYVGWVEESRSAYSCCWCQGDAQATLSQQVVLKGNLIKYKNRESHNRLFTDRLLYTCLSALNQVDFMLIIFCPLQFREFQQNDMQ